MIEELVSDRFRIDEEELEELGEDDEYWEKCHMFFLEVRDKELGSLTGKQLAWLDKIEQGLKRR